MEFFKKLIKACEKAGMARARREMRYYNQSRYNDISKFSKEDTMLHLRSRVIR